jgi:hypothetical protein
MFFSSFSDFISDVIRLANDFRKVTEIDAVISELREEGGVSVVDRHHFVAVPDPNFHVDADPNTDSDWHQYDVDPPADPIPRFTGL